MAYAACAQCYLSLMPTLLAGGCNIRLLRWVELEPLSLDEDLKPSPRGGLTANASPGCLEDRDTTEGGRLDGEGLDGHDTTAGGRLDGKRLEGRGAESCCLPCGTRSSFR